MKLILVAGTWDGNPAWIEDPTHPFQLEMAANGFETATDDEGIPFRWPTALGGIPFFGRKGDWPEHGRRLARFASRFGYGDRNFLALSHGGQVAIHAIVILWAHYGLRARSLTTVGTPRRSDVPAEQASDYVDYWQHICDSKRDLTALPRHLAGQLFDGVASTDRLFKIPGVWNKQLPDIGHSDVLKKAEHVHRWTTEGWFESIRRADGPRAA